MALLALPVTGLHSRCRLCRSCARAAVCRQLLVLLPQLRLRLQRQVAGKHGSSCSSCSLPLPLSEDLCARVLFEVLLRWHPLVVVASHRQIVSGNQGLVAGLSKKEVKPAGTSSATEHCFLYACMCVCKYKNPLWSWSCLANVPCYAQGQTASGPSKASVT